MLNCRALALLALLAVAACSPGTWLGGGDSTPPLPGERESVMLLEPRLSADPALADEPMSLPPPYRNPEWPQAGGLPNHAMHHLAADDDLAIIWRVDVGDAPDDGGRLLARPIVAAGKVFTVDAEGAVVAVAADTGEPLWEVEPDGLDGDDSFLGGGLAYENGWLFLTVSSGEVFGLDADDGTEIWRQTLSLPLRAAPTVAGGLVLVLSADNQLYALDGTTGRPIWRHAGFAEVAGRLGGPSPAVDRGIVVVPHSSGDVYALRLDTGAQLWNDAIQRPRQTLGLAEINDIDGDPVIADGYVYVAGQGGEMAAIEVRRGFRAWDLDLASNETPWIAGDYLFSVTSRGEVLAILRRDGRVRWVSALPRLSDPSDTSSEPIVWSGPVLVGDRLLLTGSDGELVAMSPYTGEILGRIDLDDPILMAPIVANGTVYVLTEEAELIALR